MVFWKSKQPTEVSEGRVSPHGSSDNEKGFTGGPQYSYEGHGDDTEIARVSDPADGDKSLHRDLTARQVSMIAIGGAIGTGLIIGTGSALVAAGPAAILISYCLVGVLVYVVMTALGEMATWMPVAGGFANYATRYVDPALGFSLGYTYWFKYIITTPNQLTAAAIVIQYWISPDRVNPGVFIAIFLVVILVINFLGVKYFGEMEFWLSSIKVLTLCGVIILMLILACGGGPAQTSAPGFQYWSNPGAFAQYKSIPGSLGKFLAVWASMVTAVFAFLGTELVGVTVGEAQNPRRNIPRAIKLTFWRILFFYILLIFLIGMVVPYTSQRLAGAAKSASNANASPFVVAIEIAGISILPAILNACILIFVFSAANSDLYIASRTLHGLALKGHAPAIFSKTNSRGVPIYALGLSSLICCIAFLSVNTGSRTVFLYFVNLVSIFGLLTWISILVSHIYFVRARRAQGVPDSDLRYVSPFGVTGSVLALIFCIIIAFTKNFGVFLGNTFDYQNFITGYLGIPLYLIMIFGWKWFKKTKGVKPHEADLWTGKDVIDRDERAWIVKEAEDKAAGRGPGKLYQHTLGYLF